MYLLSISVAVVLLLFNSVLTEITSTTTSTLNFCKQTDAKVAFTCTLNSDVDISSGYTMKLKKKDGENDVEVASTTVYKKTENAITVTTTAALNDEFRCWVEKNGGTSISSQKDAPHVAYKDPKYCVEGTTSALTVAKDGEKYKFTCELSGNQAVDVTADHDLVLTQDDKQISTTGKDTSETSIAGLVTATAFDGSKTYKCKITTASTQKSQKSSTEGTLVLETPKLTAECSTAKDGKKKATLKCEGKSPIGSSDKWDFSDSDTYDFKREGTPSKSTISKEFDVPAKETSYTCGIQRQGIEGRKSNVVTLPAACNGAPRLMDSFGLALICLVATFFKYHYKNGFFI